MGGFFGCASREDCLFDLFYGTDYHSHLGTRRAGIAVYGEKEGFNRAIHNIENSPFRTKFENDVEDMKGNLGIGESAFSGCKSLKGVTVPSTVESVGRSAFAGCLSLEEVTFSGCTSVDKYAFSECTSLRCVVYEGSAGKPYSVSSEAFSKAAALERVEFSEGLGELGQFCFEDCAALKTVYLPKSLTSVAPNAFSGTALEKVYYAGSESEWNAITIGGGNDALKNAAVEFNKTR